MLEPRLNLFLSLSLTVSLSLFRLDVPNPCLLFRSDPLCVFMLPRVFTSLYWIRPSYSATRAVLVCEISDDEAVTRPCNASE